MASSTQSSRTGVSGRGSLQDRGSTQQTSRHLGGRVLFILPVLALFCVSQVFAQSTFGTLVGTVKDPSGAVVAGSVVTASNNGTSAQRSTVTDKEGGYVLVNMEPGSYQIVMQSAGFQPVTI